MAAPEKINRLVWVKGLTDQNIEKNRSRRMFGDPGFFFDGKKLPQKVLIKTESPMPGQWMRGLDSHNLLTELHRVGWRGWSLGK